MEYSFVPLPVRASGLCSPACLSPPPKYNFTLKKIQSGLNYYRLKAEGYSPNHIQQDVSSCCTIFTEVETTSATRIHL